MTAKKVTKRKTSSVKKEVNSRTSWHEKYSYTRKEMIFRLALLALAVFIVFNYRSFVIAATVNGEPISRFSIIQQLEKQQGGQLLDNLINESIIRQQAKAKNMSVSEDEKNGKISQLETDLKDQGQDLDEILTSQGMSRDDLKKQIELQVMVEKLVGDSIEVTDEELNKYVTDNKSFLPEGKSDEELKELAREQLKQQKLSQSFSSWLAEQRNNSKINRFVSY